MSSLDKKPSLLSLPDDFLYSCIARISRFYYPTLSLVSKRFRSLIVSPELYKTRSLLGHTESCLYVCLGLYDQKNYYLWFMLCRRRPNQTMNNDTKSSGYVLAALPIPCTLHPPQKSLVAVGSNIYHIGAYFYEKGRSSRVSILDCRSHTWHEGPPMRVELIQSTASVHDQKIYVVGVENDGYLLEVLDTNNQTWDHVPIPFIKPHRTIYFGKSVCGDGKLNVVVDHGKEVVSYNTREGRWDPSRKDLFRNVFQESYCEIDKVFYTTCQGEFQWYDTKLGMWKKLMGLVGLPKFDRFDCSSPRNFVLADYGGKMAVLWRTHIPSEGYKSKVWCSVITLERRECGEIWGNVEWVDNVLTVPRRHFVVEVVAATV